MTRGERIDVRFSLLEIKRADQVYVLPRGFPRECVYDLSAVRQLSVPHYLRPQVSQLPAR